MVWLWAVISGAVLQAVFPGIASAPTFPEELPSLQDVNQPPEDFVSPSFDDMLDRLETYLQDILAHPWPNHQSPILYLETVPSPNAVEHLFNTAPDSELEDLPSKRTRYYRKYPWKRQNARSKMYDADRYLCNPSREDVFQLLVALHDARQGNSGRTISFCNRKRPAATVFNNIRFIGRK